MCAFGDGLIMLEHAKGGQDIEPIMGCPTIERLKFPAIATTE